MRPLVAVVGATGTGKSKVSWLSVCFSASLSLFLLYASQVSIVDADKHR